MIERRNDCRGCPNCIHCGLNKDYIAYVCDECRNFDAEYRYEDRIYCEECFTDLLNDKWYNLSLSDKLKLVYESYHDDYKNYYHDWLSHKDQDEIFGDYVIDNFWDDFAWNIAIKSKILDIDYDKNVED